MSIGDTLATPFAFGRAVHVFDEVGHVLGRLAHVHIRNSKEPRGLAEVQEIENAPAV